MWVVVCGSSFAQQPTAPTKPDHSSLLPSHSSSTSAESSHRDVLDDDHRLQLPFGSFPIRTYDGRGNNRMHPDWGRAGTPLRRVTAIDYSDGVGAPAAPRRNSARTISNMCVAQQGSIPDPNGLSSFVWQWGQFLDHDIDLVPVVPEESMAIAVPAGDEQFDPQRTGTKSIRFERSMSRIQGGVRQQINVISAFIDASQVYGSDVERALALRQLDGSGRLATSPGSLLPLNRERLTNAPSANDPSFMLAGDSRANEQVGLTAMHTLFVREHNWWASRIRAQNPSFDQDDIYEYARMLVAAEIQAITYREFLPIVLGTNGLPPYRGYEPDVHPGISNVFATAAFRFGHTMIPNQLLRVDASGHEIPAGHLSLAGSFFNPRAIQADGIEPLLRGLARQPAQRVDTSIVHEVRNFLFGGPRAGGFDLAALNIQRGRDHGLPSYNQIRADFGLDRLRSFSDINPDTRVQRRLAQAYESVDDIDPWVGGLSEPPVGDALVGETWRAVLTDQFRRLRDGDRFWYQYYLTPELIEMIERQTLTTIVRRNTTIGAEIPEDPFRVR